MPSAPPIDNTIEVVTPENIAFRYEVAGPFRRLQALMIDLVVRQAIFVGLMLVAMILGIFRVLDSAFLIALGILVLFVVEWFYGGLFEAYWNGQTPGKRMLGLRVLQSNGQPITALQAILRNILRTVDLMPLVPLAPFMEDRAWMMGALPTGLVGFTSMVLTERFQRLGDVVCGTMVIAEPKHWLVSLAKVGEPRVLELARRLPPRLTLSRQQLRAVAAYVERRGVFGLQHRREVARQFAQPLTEQWLLPQDTDPDLLLCAVYHRAFVTDRDEEDESLGRSELPAIAERAAEEAAV